jgi:tetratricopeptide (TPR) repeat protein
MTALSLNKGILDAGISLVQKSLYSDAFDYFKRILKQYPDSGIDILIHLYNYTPPPKHEQALQLLIAKIYLEMQLFTQAFETIDDILSSAIDHEPTYDTLATLASKKGLISKIKPFFERAIAHNIYFPAIVTILPTIYLDEKNYTKAIALYSTLIQNNPTDYRYYTILSELYFRKRDYEAATAVLYDLIQQAPFKSEELIQPLGQILQKIPRHVGLRLLFATVLFRSLKPIEGCQTLQRLVVYHPDQKPTVLRLLNEQNAVFPNHPDIIEMIADLLIDASEYTASIQYLQSLLACSDSYSDKVLTLMMKIIAVFPTHCLALEVIGCTYFQQGNMTQALHYFDQCVSAMDTIDTVAFHDQLHTISHNPTDAHAARKATFILAKIALKSKQYAVARDYATALIPTELAMDAQLFMIDILMNEKKYETAYDHIKPLLAKHRFQWAVHDRQNHAFYHMVDQQITALSAATPTTAASIIQWGTYCFAQMAFTNGIHRLQTIPITDPLYPHAQQLLARGYFELSRYDLSQQILERLIASHSHYLDTKHLHYWCGLNHHLMSHTDHALRAFETVATHDHHYANTESFIETLRNDQYLNHNGLIICSVVHNNHVTHVLRKNHVVSHHKKRHPFEVIGFSQSYNDDGCQQFIRRQYKAAQESFELAHQMDPNSPIPLINLAHVHLHEGRLDEALASIHQAETIPPTTAYLWSVKALHAYYTNAIDAGLRAIEQAITQLPNDGLFYLLCGDLYYREHQLELATSYWQKAIPFVDCLHIGQIRCRTWHRDPLNPHYWMEPHRLSLQ